MTLPIKPSVLALLLMSAACRIQLEVDDTASVSCTTNQQCPTDRICATSIGRCVRAGADTTPPALQGTPVVDDPYVGKADTFSVQFRVSKPLGKDPTVLLVFGPTLQRAATRVALDADGLSFTFELLPVLEGEGATPEGTAALLIELVDEGGNVGRAEIANAAVFDFTDPSLVGITLHTTLEPPPTSPVDEVSAATVGSVSIVSFTMSETLANTSALTLQATPPADYAVESNVGTAYVYSLTVAPGTQQGEHAVALFAEDLAGNSVALTLGQLTVDTEPPPAPGTTTPGAVVYARRPWGVSDTAGPSSLELTGAAGSVESGALVRIFDGSQIASAQAAADGSFGPVALPGTDRLAVALDAVDGAGNVSPQAEVQDIEWTASLRGKTASGFDQNPHHIYGEPRAEPWLFGSVAILPEDAELAALGTPNLEGVARTAQRRWTQVLFDTAPVPRVMHAAAYDTLRGVTWVFGGAADTDVDTYFPELWRWSGEAWSLAVSQGAQPNGRAGHGMVYDGVRDRVVMFGGLSTQGLMNDTWEWDGVTWRKAHAGGLGAPFPRAFFAMAYDPQARRTVLFGGCGTADCYWDELLSDTWEWDGTTWTPTALAGGPSRRAAGAMAYYGGAGGVVLFGGCTSQLELDAGFLRCVADPEEPIDNVNDLWRFANGAWSNVATGDEPPARAFHHAAADGSYFYVTGGCEYEDYSISNDYCAGFDDVWAWNGGEWDNVVGGGLTLRSGGSFVYDTHRDLFLLFGGFTGGEFGDDVYSNLLAYDGTWRALHDGSAAVTSPGGRHNGLLLWASSDDRVYLVGGSPGSVGDPTFVWDGAAWQNPFSADIPTRYGLAGAFDAARNRLVVHGGSAGAAGQLDLWERQPAVGSWSQVCTTSPCTTFRPAARTQHVMAYAPGAGTYLFGGASTASQPASLFRDLWLWSGSAWTRPCSTCSIPARHCAAAAYDTARDALVVFGGTTQAGGECTFLSDPNELLGDTWEWRANTWTRPCNTGACGPAKRAGHELVYDSGRARSVLLGGLLDDVWEWDGNVWRDLTAAAQAPTSRAATMAAYDGTRRVIWLFGGHVAVSGYDDLWRWDADPGLRPSVRVDFDWNAAGVSTSSIVSATLDVYAGATGYETDITLGADDDTVGNAINGVLLQLWSFETMSWDTVRIGAHGAGAPGLLSYAADAVDFGAYVSGATKKVYARIVPSSPAGNGPADPEVRVSYAELRVRYLREP